MVGGRHEGKDVCFAFGVGGAQQIKEGETLEISS